MNLKTEKALKAVMKLGLKASASVYFQEDGNHKINFYGGIYNDIPLASFTLKDIIKKRYPGRKKIKGARK